jgi:hypothetical protein
MLVACVHSLVVFAGLYNSPANIYAEMLSTRGIKSFIKFISS